ncbi:MAG TPA: hypothetical protein VHS05_13105 [Pyrinomonadaceae bacterium]|nr:hypothetical protein [Pyrinomonadaceae bacterium]
MEKLDCVLLERSIAAALLDIEHRAVVKREVRQHLERIALADQHVDPVKESVVLGADVRGNLSNSFCMLV